MTVKIKRFTIIRIKGNHLLFSNVRSGLNLVRGNLKSKGMIPKSFSLSSFCFFLSAKINEAIPRSNIVNAPAIKRELGRTKRWPIIYGCSAPQVTEHLKENLPVLSAVNLRLPSCPGWLEVFKL